MFFLALLSPIFYKSYCMTKKYLLLIAAATMLFGACYSVTPVSREAANVKAGGLYYALPMTQICVDVTYQYYDLTDAIFSEYASEMLALDNFDVEKPYRIKNIEASYNVTADPERYYLVSPSGISVQVDSRNLLRSVGMTPQEAATELGADVSDKQTAPTDAKLVLHNATADKMLPTYNLYDRTDTFYVRGDRPGHPTGTSTKKAPRSIRQRAQAAAEEIAELNDMRADITVSDRYTVEGKAQMLQQIEEKEALLMAQFVGKPVVETVHFFLEPEPANGENDTLQKSVLFYFSRAEGICESDDYDAIPVVCTLQPDKALHNVRHFSSHGKKILPNLRHSFQYRMPSQAQLTLSCELFDYQVTLPVAQYGPVIELPHKHFKALFDPASGAIIYYAE